MTRIPVRAALAASLLALGACRSAASSSEVVAVVPSTLRGAPISMATRAGGLIFLAGRTATDSIGKGIRAETHEVLLSMQRDLAASGSDMTRVAKCTVYLLDIAEWGAMNEVYATYFPTVKPARTAVQIVATPRAGARVEIECIAAAR
ncbi:MAG: Rid family hydrolase [Gemmatimonadaceae bacterium]|jgi:2-iminobutanoate/2-iminopropanoate deaminase|nr:Rid family hydrolase [Gemmatimonadaceae bacterium]